MKRWMRMGLTATIATTVVTGLMGGVADANARRDQVTYVSPSYGLTFEYDGSVWSPFMEANGLEEGGGDFVGLESDEVRGGFLIEMHDRLDDADDCLEDVSEVILEDIDDPEVHEDDDGEPIEGSSDGVAYVAYSYQKEGVFFTSYMECHEFGDGIGVISFSLISDSRGYDDAFALSEPIIESLDTSDVHAQGEGESDRDDEEDADDDRDRDEEDEDDRDEEDEDRDRDEDDEDDRDNEDDEDDRDRDDEDEDDDRSDEDENDRDRDEEDDDDGGELADTGVYESELYGYELPYNAENWTLVDTGTDDGYESAQFRGPNREGLSVLTVTAGGSAPAEFTEYYAESFARQGDVELEVWVDPDTGDTIERENRNEAFTLYTFEHDGDEYLLYTHAITSDDGKFVVLVVGTSLMSSYDLLEEDVFPLLDQIEF